MQNLPSILSPDLGLLFWMSLAFIVVLVVVGKFGFPVIVKMVQERKNFIDESLKNAREANEKLANIKSESEAILRNAHEKQAQILKEAMATRDTIIKEAREKAQEEGRKLILEAKAQIAAERESALQEVRSSVVDLSVHIAEKVMRQKLESDSEQEELINNMLNEMTKNK